MIVRWRRNSVMIVVMCSNLISLIGYLPMAGKMWLFSAPVKPEMDLVTRSADLNANHCSATYAKVRSSLSNCALILAVLALSGAVCLPGSVSERIKATLSFRLKTTALSFAGHEENSYPHDF